MNRDTGLTVSDLDHLRQSITDILTTPLGSRVMRREYGSLLPDLIDQPAHQTTMIRLYAAIAGALMRWEPRLRLTRVGLEMGSQPGAYIVELRGTVAYANNAQDLRIPLQLGAA
ncbi:GPW/gp25 family protein [Stutzerimonas kunmingensis]|uniref:GPW/gp25 family protein n=1 Tax=Stutzerimonas kunmingensis TaxID=1211807 RepID=UPI0028AE3E0F|nr:GPW/gp25 family protein [Stutzerimonas kunmingensis]